MKRKTIFTSDIMKFIVKNKEIEYAVRDITLAFFHGAKLEPQSEIPDTGDFVYVSAEQSEKDEVFVCTAKVRIDDFEKSCSADCRCADRVTAASLLSKLFSEYMSVSLPWGVLTGIRPAKMVRELYESGKSYDEIYTMFTEKYEADESKANLAIKVAKKHKPIIDSRNQKAVSLYIGIPFCPTRCLYCSFTSQSIKFSNKLTEPYMEALIKEIKCTAEFLKARNIPIETIYIGGGTPTALDGKMLNILTDTVAESFDLSSLREYTVEAGRPDTITEEKLKILKNAGVSRISINPQTMNQKTLDIIGRRHTPEDIERSFRQARRLGFDHINADLIAGLPDEDISDFEYTLERIKAINPDSVTVHTLSVKHGSYLDMNYSMYTPTAAETVEKMLQSASKCMKGLKKEPYYLYRQKNMLGNLENVGYCNDGCECLYNIYIMDEVQSIVSLGAGGSTKIISGDRIERVFNVKEVSEYINRIDEMINRKITLMTKGLK